ncbi:MAG: hypothetical protein R2822_08340 [Spirosomataceae bacterium]
MASNSVFGDLTPAQFKSLQIEAEQLMQEGDGVVFYQMRDERYTERIALGSDKNKPTRFRELVSFESSTSGFCAQRTNESRYFFDWEISRKVVQLLQNDSRRPTGIWAVS